MNLGYPNSLTLVAVPHCMIQRLAADFALTQDGSERQALQHMDLLQCFAQIGQIGFALVHMMKLAMGLTQSLVVELDGFQPLTVALAKCPHRIAVHLGMPQENG